ncbi:hypothetical protein BACI349Y_40055 [Bacillus sp. 349Y]|nr:hypothetical protein BACI349Y_40055 [Bacillus sp. 349Y]
MVGIRKNLSIRRAEEQRLTGEGATAKLYGLAVAPLFVCERFTRSGHQESRLWRNGEILFIYLNPKQSTL